MLLLLFYCRITRLRRIILYIISYYIRCRVAYLFYSHIYKGIIFIGIYNIVVVINCYFTPTYSYTADNSSPCDLLRILGHLNNSSRITCKLCFFKKKYSKTQFKVIDKKIYDIKLKFRKIFVTSHILPMVFCMYLGMFKKKL